MKKKVFLFLFLILTFLSLVAGCSKKENKKNTRNENSNVLQKNANQDNRYLTLTSEITELTDGLSAVKYEGDYGFDEFLIEGGASSDTEVVSYLTENVLSDAADFSFGKIP